MDHLGVEEGQGDPPSGLPGLVVQHQLADDLNAVLAGLQLVVECPVDLKTPGHHIAVVGGQGQQPHDEGLQGLVDIPFLGEGGFYSLKQWYTISTI